MESQTGDQYAAFIHQKYLSQGAQYVHKRENRFYWQERTKERLTKYLQTHPIDVVLDLGCASGVLARDLARQFPEKEFIGVDFSHELIRAAQHFDAPANARFFEEDIVAWSRRWRQDSSAYQDKKILCLVMGIMGHYGVTDTLTLAVADIWGQIKHGALMMTFHNDNLCGRSILRGRDKRYWTGEQAMNFFSGARDEGNVHYRSFVLSDALACLTSGWDRQLLGADDWILKLPTFMLRKITTRFELFIERPLFAGPRPPEAR